MIDEVLHSVDPYLREIVFRELIEVMEDRNPAVVMVNLNFHEIENIVDRVVFLGKDGIRIDEQVDELKSKTRRIITEELPEQYPVLLTEKFLGKSNHIIYPFERGIGNIPDDSIKEMDLTEIMTAFMGDEYSVS